MPSPTLHCSAHRTRFRVVVVLTILTEKHINYDMKMVCRTNLYRLCRASCPAPTPATPGKSFCPECRYRTDASARSEVKSSADCCTVGRTGRNGHEVGSMYECSHLPVLHKQLSFRRPNSARVIVLHRSIRKGDALGNGA